jgi:uncharacterized DUF497 family protein
VAASVLTTYQAASPCRPSRQALIPSRRVCYPPIKKVWLNTHTIANLTCMAKTSFEWNEAKNLENINKHRVSFEEAQYAFLDDHRVIAEDTDHSQTENRYFCFGNNATKTAILTVRFTYRQGKIRIYGAGYWRKGKDIYEKTNSIQR